MPWQSAARTGLSRGCLLLGPARPAQGLWSWPPVTPNRRSGEENPPPPPPSERPCGPQGCRDEAPGVQRSTRSLPTPCTSCAATVFLLHGEQQGTKCVLNFVALIVCCFYHSSVLKILYLCYISVRDNKKE